jgi:alcohol dehydrogenase YqhD (iron-dependent ADH family)
MKAVEIIKQENITFILAFGGSVIDGVKFLVQPLRRKCN